MECLISFRAEKVFNHIDMDIKFFPELTFLYGLNGTGKTTALRLIDGLLTPSLKTLGMIDFKNIEIVGKTHNYDQISIKAEKIDGYFSLSCSNIDDIFKVPIEMIEGEESEEILAIKGANNETLKFIKNISTPMFLGIERRFITSNKINKRYFLNQLSAQRRILSSDNLIINDANYDPSLIEVDELITRYITKLHADQQTINKQFRDNLLLESFHYIDSLKGLTLKPPSEEELDKYSKMRTAISNALSELEIPPEKIENRFEKFFSKLEKSIKTLQNKSPERKEHAKAAIEWIINQNQLERINKYFEFTGDYQNSIEVIYKNFNDFITLINNFFNQTGKEVILEHGVDIKIKLKDGKKESIYALSSGERQIFIMLAHLSFNHSLLKDGIFIIDEPELSLHIAWQEMFVEAIQKANPNIQYILATHSPSIINGKNNLCVPVSKIYK